MSLFDLGGAERRRTAPVFDDRLADPRRRVRPQVAAPRVREGDARPLRERPPAAGRRGARCAATSTARSPSSRDARGGRVAHGRPASSPGSPASTPSAATSWRTFVLEDLGAAIEVMVFPKTMAAVRRAARGRRHRVRQGPPRRRDDTPKIIAMEITRPEIILDGAPPLAGAGEAPALSDERVDGCASCCAAPRRQPGVRAPRRPREGHRAAPRRRLPRRRPQRPLRRAARPARPRLHRLTGRRARSPVQRRSANGAGATGRLSAAARCGAPPHLPIQYARDPTSR